MKHSIKWFAENPVAANLFMFTVFILGVMTLPDIRKELIPNVSLERIGIETTLSGASVETIESSVCKPIENQIYDIEGTLELTAIAYEGLCSMTIDVADGYVHFSTPEQAQETAAKHFAGVGDLVLLGVEAEPLGDALKWEVSRGDALFPHLYRNLKLSDVVFAWPLPLANGSHVFPEDLAGFVDPTRPQFDAFKALDRDHPIEMLNLVRLRDVAAYPEGHTLHGKGLTGAEAYANYGRETGPILQDLSGTIVWRAGFETVLMGPSNEHWDHIFVARYPNAKAFLSMVTNPEYQKAVVHRQAAVLTSRLIRTKPSAGGDTFG